MLNLSKTLLLLCITLTAFSVNAQSMPQTQLQLEINIPRLQVAEYHKPYVAVWLENSKRQSTQIAVWYDNEMKNQKGEEWLADLRQWWRRGGRKLSLPIDGVTGATKGPGSHLLSFDLAPLLKDREPGQYKIRIEAAREVGGRELVELPITLPINNNQFPVSATGKSELGKVLLSMTK